MKMLVRDEDDPLHLSDSGEGLLNIIDLANRDSWISLQQTIL